MKTVKQAIWNVNVENSSISPTRHSTEIVIKMTKHHILIPSIIKSTRFSPIFLSVSVTLIFSFTCNNFNFICLLVGKFTSSTFSQHKQNGAGATTASDRRLEQGNGLVFVGRSVGLLWCSNSNRIETLFIVSFEQFAHLHTVTCHSSLFRFPQSHHISSHRLVFL